MDEKGHKRRVGFGPVEAVTWLASCQHGRVCRRQLLGAGVGRAAITRLVDSGWLRRVHGGVYAVAGAPETREGRWMAAVLAGGEGAALSHRSAGALWGLVEPIDGPVHVTAPSHGRRRRGIAFHRARNLASHRTVHRGIPVTSVERTLLDLARSLGPGALRGAVEAADRVGLLDGRRLHELCTSTSGHRGSGRLARLVIESAPAADTRSPLERDFRRFCYRQRLSLPVTNVPVEGFIVDCYWPDHGLVVELDGYGFHKPRAQFERDRQRDTALQLAGLLIFRVTDRRMKRNGTKLAAELRVALGLGGGTRSASRVRWADS